MDYCNIQNRKFLLVFGLSGFLFLNLTFATPYQIMMISSVYATSNDALIEEKPNYDTLNGNAYLTINADYPRPDPKDNSTKIRICVETEIGQDQKIVAVPPCLSWGANFSSIGKYQVQAPGKVVLNIEKELQIGVDTSPCTFYIYPNQDKTCHLDFTYRDMENEPLPTSDMFKKIG